MNTVPDNRSPARTVATWLLVCCGLVFALVILGGVTRLTGSGLSMAEWRPIMGTLPPLSDAEWQRVFEIYKETPEFQKVNSHMDVHDFKGIFWLEYLHRLLGRLLGLVFLLPLAAIVALRALLGSRGDRFLQAVSGFFDSWGKRILVALMLLARSTMLLAVSSGATRKPPEQIERTSASSLSTRRAPALALTTRSIPSRSGVTSITSPAR